MTGTALESVIILLLTDCVGPWKGGPISDIEFSKMKISGFQSPYRYFVASTNIGFSFVEYRNFKPKYQNIAFFK